MAESCTKRYPLGYFFHLEQLTEDPWQNCPLLPILARIVLPSSMVCQVNKALRGNLTEYLKFARRNHISARPIKVKELRYPVMPQADRSKF